jgi:tripartite-type tricarboxylate transporter receptor subunit TctC
MKSIFLSLMFYFAATIGAGADSFPSRPITMVVPAAKGGPSDAIARTVAAAMQSSLGQAIVIENSLERAGSVGVGRVARAVPDGYTIVFGNVETHVFNGVYFQLDYDVLNDFEAIAPLAFQPMLIAVGKGVPANDLKTLIELLKKNPGNLSAATGRIGSLSHLVAVLFQRETGTTFKIQPYPGSGPAMQHLLSGEIDFMIDLTTYFVPQVRNGTVKAIAVMARNRVNSLPSVPTIDEAGAAGLYASEWAGLWAPAKTPIADIEELNRAVVKAFADPSVRSQITSFGAELPPRERQSPAALTADHKAEIDRWWPILRAANIRP